VLPLVRWVVVLLLTLSLQKDDSEAVDNTSGLGCAFLFYSGSTQASFFGILIFLQITSDSAEHTSK
jgi:hypothetical protein